MRRALFVVSLLLVGCHGPLSAPPSRACGLTVWYQPSTPTSVVSVIGSWNGWAEPGRALDAGRSDGWRVTRLDLSPGEYSYALLDNGVVTADPNVATTAFHDGQEVSWVKVADCGVPALEVTGSSGSSDGHAAADATFLAARDLTPLDPRSLAITDRSGAAIAGNPVVDAARGTIHLTFAGLAPGKHVLSIAARDTHGRAAEPALATVWIEPRPFDTRDLVIYQIMVDRYRDRSGQALAPPNPASARAGGHIDGVRLAIESGQLSDLGFNAIWLSPLYLNPTGMFPGADGLLYSAYHGYWPIAARALDPQVADEASLDALIAAAHARGIRVLFDVVPNHVHEQHPYFVQHKSDGWFNHPDGSCVCGVGACDWASHIEDCWFAPYLPDLDWTNPAVADQITSDVAWWLERFDGDGLRIDAVPMMPRAATRRIVAQVRGEFDNPGHHTFLLGENFTGPDGFDELRYQLGPSGLDSEFDFPLLWALRSSFGDESAPLTALDATIREGEQTFSGSGAVMARTIGNHDVPRFASVAAGDGGGDPWTPAVQSTDPEIYARQKLALATIYALPGAPVVYYGDELALAGHADPDSRRVLPADGALSPLEESTRDFVRALGRARGCAEALRRGSYRTLAVDAEHLIFARELAGAAPVVVELSRKPTAAFPTPLPGLPSGDYVDLLDGTKTSLSSELTTWPVELSSAHFYVSAADPCAAQASSGGHP